jgi:hypothetical protein
LRPQVNLPNITRAGISHFLIHDAHDIFLWLHLDPMAAGFDDLPTELWLLIARYLSSFQLCKLKSVNSFFLNRWMDVKWKVIDVDISARYSKTTFRLLNRVLYVDEKFLLSSY